MTAATLFGVGGTFAQFLFQHRGVSIDWLVTMRLLCAGSALLAISAIKQFRSGTLVVHSAAIRQHAMAAG